MGYFSAYVRADVWALTCVYARGSIIGRLRFAGGFYLVTGCADL